MHKKRETSIKFKNGEYRDSIKSIVDNIGMLCDAYLRVNLHCSENTSPILPPPWIQYTRDGQAKEPRGHNFKLHIN